MSSALPDAILSFQKVYLNVYDLSPNNDTLIYVGLGAFHSGLEVHGAEWTYGSGSAATGVFDHTPKQAPGVKLRATILLGETSASRSEVEAIVTRMKPLWPGNKYHIVRWCVSAAGSSVCVFGMEATRRRRPRRDFSVSSRKLAYPTHRSNCNAFADELAVALLGAHIPGWVNRLAYIGSLFSCLLPDSMGADSAPSADGGGGDGGGGSGFQVFAAPNRRGPAPSARGGGGGGGGSGGGGGVRSGGYTSVSTSDRVGGGGGGVATSAGGAAGGAAATESRRLADREKMMAAAVRRAQGGGGASAAPAGSAS